MSFAGLILAGGEGRRWGGAKAWARLPDGTTFLEACAATLRLAGASPVVATLPPDSSPDDCPGVLTEQLPHSGLDMFASLEIGLQRLLVDRRWDAVVVLPVDHPLVASKTVTALIDAGSPAGIATFGGHHGHPVSLWRDTVEVIATGAWAGCTLRDVLHVVGATDVNVDDRGVRANCNTPEALEKALQGE